MRGSQAEILEMNKLDKLFTLIPLQGIDEVARQQIHENLTDERVLKMAIMPDVHAGYDLPIGGVALVDGHVAPSYVGYDIGCGMCSVNTGVLATDIFSGRPVKEEIFHEIMRTVPLGVGRGRKQKAGYPAFESVTTDKHTKALVNKSVKGQLGSLGSGNHFIEISADQDGLCWVTIHSGSRNAGHSVGTYYMGQAKKAKDKFLPLSSELGKGYLADLAYCQEFALENRKRMMTDVLAILGFVPKGIEALLQSSLINENHNHAELQADGCVLHRKGATPAEKNQFGVIPANMRDGIYVTRGLGNQTYLSSASHGAGRVMSRSEGKKKVKLPDFKEAMKGIVAKVDNGTLDEAPFVYKDIHAVLEAQQGVVIEVVNFLKPLINIKG